MTTEKPSFPSDAADKFVVRFPAGMRELIASEAKSNNRSMNAEIVARLAASFDPSSESNQALLLSHRQLAESLVTYLTQPWSEHHHSPTLLDLAEKLRDATKAVMDQQNEKLVRERSPKLVSVQMLLVDRNEKG